MIVVMALVVDLGLGPAEDPKGVVGAEVDDGYGNGARPRFPGGRRREELVAYEMVVARVRRRVDADPIKVGGRVDVGPGDSDIVAGFAEGGGGDRDCDFGEGDWCENEKTKKEEKEREFHDH